MQVLCECDSFNCNLAIEISVADMQEIKSDPSKLIISGICPTGPEPTDELVEDRGTYKIYRERS